MKKRDIQLLLFCLVVPLFFLCISPLAPFNSGVSGTDSSVFRTIALQMSKGLVPYKDTFDHKGPLLYLINYFGLSISFKSGVWYIEYLSLAISIYFMIKICTLVLKDSLARYFICILSLLYFVTYYEQGNLTEEFAIPFLSYSLYVFLDYFITNKTSALKVVGCGLSFCSVCLLRPNMCALWIVFCFSILIQNICKKQIKELFFFIWYFLIGAMLVLIPIFLWLYFAGALKSCIECFIIFNSKYSASQGNIKNVLKSAYTFSKTFMFIFIFTITLFCLRKKEKHLYFTYLIYLFLNIMMIAMAGRTYGHYGMILVPSVVFPISIMYSYISNNERKIVALFISCFLLFEMFASSISVYGSWVYSLVNYIKNGYYQTELIKKIKTNSDENDKITVYGNCDVLYLLSDRLPATRYSYQLPIGDVNPTIMNEYFDMILDEKPSLFVCPKGEIEKVDKFLNENNYRLIWKGDEDNPYLVYKYID